MRAKTDCATVRRKLTGPLAKTPLPNSRRRNSRAGNISRRSKQHRTGRAFDVVAVILHADRGNQNAARSNRLAQFRHEYDALIAPYLEENIVRQDYLLPRATKI